MIDFHTHFFPDNIAQRAVGQLSEAGNVVPHGDGTIHALKRIMEEDGVSLSINLPVATKPDQVIKLNRFAVEHADVRTGVISFGAMHPDFSSVGNIKEEIAFLAHHGVRGIKMHPEYQKFYPDEISLYPIYEACAEFGLLVHFHAGRDIAFDKVHGTPERFSKIPQLGRGLRVVLAHMGGYQMWEEVTTNLIGLPDFFFDTAYCLTMEDWQMKEIIFGHGAYKILFGSDMPWNRPGDIAEKIKRLDIGSQFEEMIFEGNAKRILGLD